jgi:hypothetical protein
MTTRISLFQFLVLLTVTCITTVTPAADAIPPITRVLPPEGLEIPPDVRSRLEARLAALRIRLDVAPDPWLRAGGQIHPDIEIFLKAVDYALLHREFYLPKDFEKADWALEQAEKRTDALLRRDASYQRATGLVVRGYRSRIDNSVQPYGLVIPENHDFQKLCPLYVWMHGRGDKSTDLHFLFERASRQGQIAPPGAIVVHVFGRQCVGYKSAGEQDVHEAVAAVKAGYKIDDSRKVLMGFSMGGAGAWQVGAHSAGNWVAISPGAGFAETAKYQRLTPDRYPPAYEQTLWGVNDVPNYVRNLFNTNVIAYSGELDRQIQAARVMEEAYQAEGRTLTHLIGPGVEHKYEPNTLAELMKRLDGFVQEGRDPFPSEVYLQTRTLRYFRQDWVIVDGLEQHWQDSRIDASRQGDKTAVKTKNIARFRLILFPQSQVRGDTSKLEFEIDGQTLTPRPDGEGISQARLASFVKRDGKWDWSPNSQSLSVTGEIRKHFGCQGPIDDAFVEPFLVVTPTGRSKNAAFQAWVDFELQHLRDRWRALMRGDLPEKRDSEFTADDEKREINLILFGDPDSNAVIARLLNKTPLSFSAGKWTFGEQSFDGNRYVPALIFPRKLEHSSYPNYTFQYVVLNSGLTFREGHDRTNSIQNPKLPDWALIDLTQPPDNLSPGRIHDAGFFDESWKLKAKPKAP